jgi:hypothetical protein
MRHSEPSDLAYVADCRRAGVRLPGVRDSRTSECVAEDAIGPIIGYREWVLIADEILSPLARTPWGAGPIRAECLPDCRPAQGLWRTASTHPEPAPAHGCVCGIYALFTPQRSRGRERLAVLRGAVVPGAASSCTSVAYGPSSLGSSRSPCRPRAGAQRLWRASPSCLTSRLCRPGLCRWPRVPTASRSIRPSYRSERAAELSAAYRDRHG